MKRRIVIFSILALLAFTRVIAYPLAIIGDAAGILLGLGLVYLATKDTIFEKRDNGLYFRSHIWIELTILFLFFGRIFYRFYVLYAVLHEAQTKEELHSTIQSIRDPVTAAMFFIFCTYYIGYFLFILKRAKVEHV